MNRYILPVLALVVAAGVFLSCKNEETPMPETKNGEDSLVQIRKEIEAVNRQFALDFNSADSVALADHYASDGRLGTIKGKDNLMSAWGNIIRDAEKEGNPIVNYITNALAGDGEYVAELGTFQMMDKERTVKQSGKYLVVWKKENGEWKLYRDMSL